MLWCFNDLLKEGKFETFLRLVKDGYGLKAFILNVLVDNWFEDKLDEVLEVSHRLSDDVFDFFVLYWNKEKAEDYWVRHTEWKQFHFEGLIRNQLWDELLIRKAFEPLVTYAPLDFLKNKVQYYDKKYLFQELVKQKRYGNNALFIGA